LEKVPTPSGGGKRKDDGSSGDTVGDEESAARVAAEVVRLRQEQRANEERLAALWCRVQQAERRPKQMLTLPAKAAGDPRVVHLLLAGAGRLAAGPGYNTGAPGRARLLRDVGRSAVDDDATARHDAMAATAGGTTGSHLTSQCSSPAARQPRQLLLPDHAGEIETASVFDVTSIRAAPEFLGSDLLETEVALITHSKVDLYLGIPTHHSLCSG
jgi:hypothetical protein